MKLLLDTHVLIWSLEQSKRLSPQVEQLIQNAQEFHVSVVSLWEMAIKHSLGRLQLTIEFGELPAVIDASGFEILPIQSAHAVQYHSLPMLHRDPFDRMLVAQSISEPLRLVTTDRVLPPYGNTVLAVLYVYVWKGLPAWEER